ncbi:hypothetical protein U1Q18_048814 [Sarracenia purpurea var. burkii]
MNSSPIRPSNRKLIEILTDKPIHPAVMLSFGTEQVLGSFDTGCSHVLMDEDRYESIKRTYPELKNCELATEGFPCITGIDGGKVDILKIVRINFHFADQPGKKIRNRTPDILIVRNMEEDMILGWSFVQKLRGSIDYENCEFIYIDQKLKKTCVIPFRHTNHISKRNIDELLSVVKNRKIRVQRDYCKRSIFH